MELHIPESLINNSEETIEILAFLCKKTGVKIKSYPSRWTCTLKPANIDYWAGVEMAVTYPRITRLDKAKKSLELGRATVFAMMIKGHFATYNLSNGLVKNNFFFGNAPEQKNLKNPIIFGSKLTMINLFNEIEIGETYYAILNQFLNLIGLYDFSSDDKSVLTRKFLIGFDDLVKENLKPIVIKQKGKLIKQGKHRADFPTRSPLYLNEEINFVQKFIAPLYLSQDNLKKDYLDLVYEIGFDSVRNKIRSIYNERYRVLRDFANCSTKRLQIARQLKGVTDLKKKDVVKDNVLALLNRNPEIVNNFIKELRFISGERSFLSCLDGFCAQKCLPDGKMSFLVYQIYNMYANILGVDLSRVKEVHITVSDIDSYLIELDVVTKTTRSMIENVRSSLRIARMAYGSLNPSAVSEYGRSVSINLRKVDDYVIRLKNNKLLDESFRIIYPLSIINATSVLDAVIDCIKDTRGLVDKLGLDTRKTLPGKEIIFIRESCKRLVDLLTPVFQKIY